MSKIGKRATQEINYNKTFSDIAKSVEEVDKPDRIGEVVARAIRIAESGTLRTCCRRIADGCPGGPDAATVARRKGAAVRPNDSDTASVADMIKAAERLIMIVGGRIDSAKARRSLLAASEAWGIPVLPTYVHQDVFPNDHPNYAGELDTAAERCCGDRVGCGFDCRGRHEDGNRYGQYERTTSDRRSESRACLSGSFGHRPTLDVELGIVSDAGAFLESLAAQNAPELSDARKSWIVASHAGYTDFADSPSRPADDGLDFGHVIDAMKTHVPDDAVITVDAGSFSSWLHHKYLFKSSQNLLGPNAEPWE